MRMIRTVVACVVVLALGMATATAASAAEAEYPLTGLPEIGRCVHVARGTGNFNFANCVTTDKDGEDGEYRWKPGPNSEHAGFKFAMGSPQFETVHGGKINCTVGFMKGNYENGKEVKISETVLDGCLNLRPNKGCQSNPIETGKIASSQPLTGELGFLPNAAHPENPYVGIDLKAEPETLPFLMFDCGEGLTAESIEFTGSVIGRITKLNKMLNFDGLEYKQKLGKQKWEAFKGGLKDTLTETVSPVTNPTEKTSEQAGLNAPTEIQNAATIEFKAKQK